MEEEDLDQLTEDEIDSAEDIAYLAHHKIDTLIEVLLAKGLVTEDELKKKSQELSFVEGNEEE